MIRPCYYDEGVKVEVSYLDDRGYCEVGLYCEKNCSYSFKKNEIKNSNKAFALEFGICEECNKLVEECFCKSKGVD